MITWTTAGTIEYAKAPTQPVMCRICGEDPATKDGLCIWCPFVVDVMREDAAGDLSDVEPWWKIIGSLAVIMILPALVVAL